MIAIAHASNHIAAAQNLVFKINEVFLFPLIALLSAIAFLMFLYGAFEYVRNSASQEGRQTGQRHLLYGIIGLLVMFSAFTLLQIAANTFGVPVNQGVPTTNTLSGPGDPGFVPPPQARSPDAYSGVSDGINADTSTDGGFGTNFGSGVDDNSGFDRGDQAGLAEPDTGADSPVVPGGLTNPDPLPGETAVDQTSQDPDHPLLDVRRDQDGTVTAYEVSCGDSDVTGTCVGGMDACTEFYKGAHQSIVGTDDNGNRFLLCTP